MTDINAPDQIPSTTLAGVSIYPNGNDEYAFVMVDEDGDVRAYRLSRNRLKHMFVHIGTHYRNDSRRSVRPTLSANMG